MRLFADRTVAVLQGLHIMVDGLYDSIPILLSFMVLAFGAQERDAGIILSCGALFSTIAGLCTKGCSQSFGFLRTLAIIFGGYTVGYLGNLFSGTLWFSGLLFMIAMAGFGIFHNVAFSYLTSRTERRQLGRVLGDFTATGDIGRIPITAFAGFAAAGSLWDVPGWRWICLLYGGTACLIVLGILYAFIRHGEPAGLVTKKQTGRSLLPPLSLLKNRHTASTLAANVIDTLSSEQIFPFLPFLLFAKGMEPSTVGSFALAFTAGGFVGKTVCGRLVGRFGTRPVFITAKIIMTGLLAILVAASSLPTIIVTSALLGAATKGSVPVLQTLLVEPVTNPGDYDDLFALNTFSRSATNILAPLLFGVIASSLGVAYSYSLMTIMAVLSVLPVVCTRAHRKG